MTNYQIGVTSFLFLAFLCAALLHRALKQNGRVFLDELFANHPAAGRALVRLLDIGYLLFNVGYMTLAAATFSPWSLNGEHASDAIRPVASAIGIQLLLLSMAHGINVWLFSRKVSHAMRANQREIEELLRS